MADIRMSSTTESAENMNAALGITTAAKPAESETKTEATTQAGAEEEGTTEETTDAQTGSETGEEGAGGRGDERYSGKTIQTLKARISKLAHQRHSTDQSLQQATAEIDRLNQRLRQIETSAPKGEESRVWPARSKPQESEVGEKYKTYADFVEDLADWKAEVKVAEAEAKRRSGDQTRQEQDRAEAAQRELQQDQANFTKRVEKFVETHPNYVDVVSAVEDFPTPPTMQMHLLKSDVGPDLVYYMATHVEEARNIAALPPARMLVELGKLEERLKPRVEKKVPPRSKAPIPPTPVRSTETRVATTSDQMSYADWVKARKQEIRSR